MAFITASLFAQTPAARLVGDVRDASGAGVPGAAVTVKSIGTNEARTVRTNAAGEYSVPNLQPGLYDAEADAAGFRRLKQTGVELQVNQTARLDFRLQIGAVAESIEVNAQIPLLNTENSVKGDVIVNAEIANMPLNGRDFFELGLLVPGVTEKHEGTWQGSAMAVNGARPDNTNFVVDGFNNQNQRGGHVQTKPPLDAMQEFKVETSGYSAEFGRLAGGVVNMALKSGSNKYHGALFEFLRNDKLDARNFFAADTPHLRRNQFGASLGGPVYLPRVYNGRDKTFFFFSWESFRQGQGNVRVMRVPTALEHAGDFSQTMSVNGGVMALKDPLASGSCNASGGGGCFPGNRIPASRFSSAATVLRTYYPLPNMTGSTNNYRAYAINQNDSDSFLFKVDHRLTAVDSLSVRYTYRKDPFHDPFAGSDLGTFGYRDVPASMLGGIAYTRMFSPALVNEFRVGYTRNTEMSRSDNAGHDFAAELGIPGSVSAPDLVGFPRFTVVNLPALGDPDQTPHHLAVNTIEAGDTATWVKGDHTLKFGGNILRGQVLQVYNKNVRGTFNIADRWTNIPFGDFLLGMLNKSTRATGSMPLYIFNTDVGAFVQDDYRVRPNFTLNVGLRYEYSEPMNEKYDRLAGFVPQLEKLIVADDRTVPNLQAQIAQAGLDGKVGLARDYGLPRGLAYSKKTNFAPRLGFAWRPWGGSRAVIRGGYGIFYAGSANDPIRLDLGNVFPFAGVETYNRNASKPDLLTLLSPFPKSIAKTDGVTDVNGQDLHPSPQYLQCWNLTIEKQITATTALEIGYAGSKGTHLGSNININTPDRSSGQPLPNGTYPKPYAQFNAVRIYRYDGNSSYNAAMLTLRRRFANNFFYRVNYTFSKSLDDASQITGGGTGGGATLDPRNRHLDRGRSAWDAQHVFTTTFSYEVPARFGRWLRRWQFAGSGRMASGRPFTPSVSNSQEQLGEGSRPDRIATGTLDNPSADRWFDLSAFPVVPVGTPRFGNSGRNILNGPATITLNVALMKKFRLGEFGTLQFRTEAFNVTNHANFMLPNRNVNAINGGVITQAGAARVFQAALRFDF